MTTDNDQRPLRLPAAYGGGENALLMDLLESIERDRVRY
mgnify:CR=1 FL=1